MNRKVRLHAAVLFVVTLGIACGSAAAQSAISQTVPELVRQSQTQRIPLFALDRRTLLPVKNLSGADFALDIDGKPRGFQLSRPWTDTVDPKTGQPTDRPNLLIILPLANPVNRTAALKEAIDDLGRQPDVGWNISILDDSGNQTPYTRDRKTIIADLVALETAPPEDVGLEGWRRSATLAIAGMRDLPGRRVVMSLGDIFHEVVLENGRLVYENFEAEDIATAARNAGAMIYAADSASDVGALRQTYPFYSLSGSGPWLLVARSGELAGWISGSVSDTLGLIRRNAMGAYDIELHLDLKQLDGRVHIVSVTPRQAAILLTAPPFYVAPDLPALRELAAVSPVLRQALRQVPAPGSSPLDMSTRLSYFPHPDRRSGTQIATTGFFWTGTAAHPARLQTGLQLEQAYLGVILDTTIGTLHWNSADREVWNQQFVVVPGTYRLHVAAADSSGKIAAATDTPFTVAPTTDEPVLISSLVLGKSCVFTPQPPGPATTDYLRIGQCDLQPDASGFFSPQDIVWTLVRITPTGKLARRPSKDWKSSFLLVDAAGHKLAEQRAEWLPARDGSLVASVAFPLDNPKLKLHNGDYAIVFRLKGPGIESGYGQDAPFTVYGASAPDHAR